MNAQLQEMAQSAQSESLCGHCGRPWFGVVAYCPYCGRKPGFATQAPGERPQRDQALASGTLGMPAGALPGQDPGPPPQEPRATPGRVTGSTPQRPHAARHGPVRDHSISRQMGAESVTPLQVVPVSGETLPLTGDRPAASRLNRAALTLLFKTVAAGLSALLLFWMVVKLLAPTTNEGAPPQLKISASGIVSPGPAPSTSAAHVPSIPRRTGAAVPAPSSRRSLCSVAHETAGLCKSQE